MPKDLAAGFLRVAEAAAIAAARTTGQGERMHSDQMATEAMRTVMHELPMRGRIVIGEGERDEAPMLYIGEEVGQGAENHPRIDIAVDPLEGTNLCATDAPGAIAVLAAAGDGGLLHAPDCYMQKLIVGPAARGKVDLEAPVAENMTAIAKAHGCDVTDVTVVVLERPRHEGLMREIRTAGARIRTITDGDLAPAISACLADTPVHAVMGVGGAPEGVLAAAVTRCMGGGMLGRLREYKPGDRQRAEKMGVTEFDTVHTEETLAPGPDLLFVATGVTDGELLKGVKFLPGGCRTHSLLLGTEQPRRVRFVETIQQDPDSAGAMQL